MTEPKKYAHNGPAPVTIEPALAARLAVLVQQVRVGAVPPKLISDTLFSVQEALQKGLSGQAYSLLRDRYTDPRDKGAMVAEVARDVADMAHEHQEYAHALASISVILAETQDAVARQETLDQVVARVGAASALVPEGLRAFKEYDPSEVRSLDDEDDDATDAPRC